jgi:hypothetical protein
MCESRDPDSNETEINALQSEKHAAARVSTLAGTQIDLSNWHSPNARSPMIRSSDPHSKTTRSMH